MQKQYLEDNDIFIDRCPKCNGVWLESGKLEIILDNIEDEETTTMAMTAAVCAAAVSSS